MQDYYAILHNNQPTHYEDITDHPHVVKERIKVCYSSLINVESNHPAWENCIFGESKYTFVHCTVEGKAQHLLYNNQPNRLKEIEGICFAYMHTSCVYINVYTEISYTISSFIRYIHIHVYKWEWHYWCIIWYNTIQRNVTWYNQWHQ